MGYAWLTRLPKVELHVHMEDAIPTTPYGRGLLVCVNTDNPRIFHNSLADEFWQLRTHLGISHADVRRLILNGVKASWLPQLVLTNVEITDAGLAQLRHLRRLEVLLIDGAAISDASLENLRGLDRLSGLWLKNTHVTGSGFENLKGLTRLQVLRVSGSPITDEGLRHLAAMRRLIHVDLQRSGVSSEAVAKLQNERPILSITPP
jgi:hypothetical protein